MDTPCDMAKAMTPKRKAKKMVNKAAHSAAAMAFMKGLTSK